MANTEPPSSQSPSLTPSISSNIDPEKGLVAWFARNSVAANLLMWFLIFGGLYSALTIQKQVFPNFEFSIINVSVVYLGAAPQEVEEGVIVKIEEVLKDLEGIKTITSTAVEGLASISIEVEGDYNIESVLDEVKVQVDSITSFPANTENPLISRQKIQSDVLWVSVYGDASERELKEFAKTLRDDIASLSGISSVQVVGARDYEISIELSESVLQEYNLTFAEVVNAIQQSSVDLPGGSIKTDTGNIVLRTIGQAYNGWDFSQIVLLTQADGTRVKLGDVAVVKDGFEETTDFAVFDGEPATSIRVLAVGDQNALAISKQVNQYIKDHKDSFPSNIKVDAWGDRSFYLNDRLNMMLENMFFGALLVFIVLSLFLRIKLAFWVIVGLPVAFLGALLVLPLGIFDVSINLLSLFAFILVLGIVVDDAIIMGESAYSEVDEHGYSKENIIRGVQKVAMPATFGVLTTIAAFVPMLFVTGTFSVLWKTIGAVVVACLVFSLVESKLILPAHLANTQFTPYDPNNANWFQKVRDFFSEGIKIFVQKTYKPFLKKSVENRYVTLSIFLSALIITISLSMGGIVRFVILPDIPNDFIVARVDMEPGSSIQQRNYAINEVRLALERMDKKIEQQYGEKVVKHSITKDDTELEGSVDVELTKGEERQLSTFDIFEFWWNEIPEIPGVRSLLLDNLGGNSAGSDLNFEFSSDDINELKHISSDLRKALLTYSGVYDVNDTFSGSSQEIQINVKPQAQALGISLQQLGQQVRFGFFGAEVQRIQRDDEEIKVMVRYPQNERNSVGYLENMRVRTERGDVVPFEEVGSIALAQGYDSIIRVDGERSINVTANVDIESIDPGDVTQEIVDNIIPDLLQRYPNVDFELQGNSKEQQELFLYLGLGMIFALFAIFTLLAIPLKSYTQPLIIMSVIPFGIVGAIAGHLLLGKAVSVLSICGIIALSGVVVNDSLIMVDFVNRARQEGLRLIDAAINAGAQRFRAIILTSLTTFMGLLPILLEKSLQAQAVIPMAISLAFGILFATVITLLLVPCLYLILEDFKKIFKRKNSSTNVA